MSQLLHAIHGPLNKDKSRYPVLQLLAQLFIMFYCLQYLYRILFINIGIITDVESRHAVLYLNRLVLTKQQLWIEKQLRARTLPRVLWKWVLIERDVKIVDVKMFSNLTSLLKQKGSKEEPLYCYRSVKTKPPKTPTLSRARRHQRRKFVISPRLRK